MDILIAGGENSLVDSSFVDRLRQFGMEPRWIWPDEGFTSRAIPLECEGVIVLKNWVSHRLGDYVCGEARNRNIPLARVTSKFSHAFPILRDMGFIREGQEPPTDDVGRDENGTDSDSISPEKLAELTYTALKILPHSDTDEPPTLETVQQQIRDTLGQAVVLDQQTYLQTLNKVFDMKQRIAKKQAQEEAKLPTKPPYDWALLHLEEKPELLIAEDTLISLVIEGLSETEKEAVTDEEIHETVSAACVHYRKQLASICDQAHRVATEGDKLWEMQVAWLQRILPKYAKNQRELSHKQRVAIQEESLHIFGRKVFWKTILAQFARIKDPGHYSNTPIFGPTPPVETIPADAISLGDAFKDFIERGKTFAHEHGISTYVFNRSLVWFRKLVQDGTIKGFKEDDRRTSRWMTTTDAVRDFTDQWCNKTHSEWVCNNAHKPEVIPTPELTPALPEPIPEVKVEVEETNHPVFLEMIEALRTEIADLKAEVQDLRGIKTEVQDLKESLSLASAFDVDQDTNDTEGRLQVMEDSILRLNEIAAHLSQASAEPSESAQPDLRSLLKQGYKINLSL